MSTVRAIYDGQVFVPLTPVKAEKNQVAIFTLIEQRKTAEPARQAHFSKAVKPHKRFLGALPKENIAELETILKEADKVDIDEW
jgi:hypothetical protein